MASNVAGDAFGCMAKRQIFLINKSRPMLRPKEDIITVHALLQIFLKWCLREVEACHEGAVFNVHTYCGW